MVAAISTPINPKRAPTPTRRPLLPSESDNALAPPRRPKAREVTSRYMSTSSSSSSVSSTPKRCVSPQITARTTTTGMIGHTPTPQTLPKRSRSAERRRQGTPRPNNNNNSVCGGGSDAPSAAQKMLFTSTRRLSVSFQGESFSIQVSKAKPERRRLKTTTPSRNGNGDSDQHRWPGKLPQANCMNRSLDCADSARKPGNVVRSLQNSVAETQRSERNDDCGSEVIPSDNESVTSGSSSECGGAHAPRGSRAIVVPARFWQEANNRLSRNGGNKSTVVVPPKKFTLDSPVSSPRGIVNSRGRVSSPIRSASPSKLATPWSPSRVRNGVAATLSSNRFGNEPSVLSFAVDVPRGKIGGAHSLRLTHNRLMQWRFVNARADAALSAQTLNAEQSLHDAWVATSKLRESVRAKRIELQLLKQEFKLKSILKEQMIYLEDWAILDPVYSSSLSGAIEALKASTLRLPVVGGAKADVLNVKDAICSAMDVMQAMASSICVLLPKVGHVNSLVVEVANINANERVLLEECKDLLSMITTMQVRECSLRTHISQLKCLPRS